MSDAKVQIQPESTGPKVDVSELTTGAGTVERQRVVIGSDSDGAAFAEILHFSDVSPFSDPVCLQVVDPSNAFVITAVNDVKDAIAAAATYEEIKSEFGGPSDNLAILTTHRNQYVAILLTMRDGPWDGTLTVTQLVPDSFTTNAALPIALYFEDGSLAAVDGAIDPSWVNAGYKLFCYPQGTNQINVAGSRVAGIAIVVLRAMMIAPVITPVQFDVANRLTGLKSSVDAQQSSLVEIAGATESTDAHAAAIEASSAAISAKVANQVYSDEFALGFGGAGRIGLVVANQPLVHIDAATASLDAKTPAKGSATSANSSPVVIASDQAAVPVSAASLPLPSGASTAANQTTGNTSLASIDGKLTSVTVGTCALPSGASTAANQATGNTSLSSIDGKLTSVTVGTCALPAGAATAAKQDTGNTSLGSIDTKLSSQATAANQSTGNTSLGSIDTSASGILARFPAAAAVADVAAASIGSLTRLAAVGLGFDGTDYKRLRTDLAGFSSRVLATVTGAQQVHPLVIYNTTRPAPADTQATSLQANSRGDLCSQEQYAPVAEDNTVGVIWGQMAATASATNAWTEYKSGATLVGTAGVNVKSTAGRLRRIYAANTNATTNFWLVLVNKASAPVANDVAVGAFPIPNIALAAPIAFPDGLDFGPEGKYMATGLSYAVSTTPHKVTLPGTSDCVVFADYA